MELNDWPGGRPTFYDRRGLPVSAVAPVSGGPHPVDELIRENQRRGVDPGFATCGARYRSEDLVPVSTYVAALQALDRSG